MTLDIDELREHVGAALSDAALSRLLDSAYQAIANEIGPPGPVEEILSRTYGPLLMLSRPAAAILSIVEDTLTLDPDDYELRSSGQTLRRLLTGPNPRSYWRGPVDVRYEPITDEATRDRVAVEICKLDLTYQPGLSSQSSDSWSETYATLYGDDYIERRRAILSSLSSPVFLR